MPISATPTVATVVQDEPMSTLTRAQSKLLLTKNHSGLRICMP